ncbi:AAA family ATPase [Xylanivirga thermophila]|jgi:DNA-directed RNA polymerase subunit F|uniref:AAA family ATPase n=1 Tax=Xylanivirga thermophila TaxID=2496273 RepID=UPI00101C0AC3|nr:AAA family ATPase [Xylanivirga thermophila]
MIKSIDIENLRGIRCNTHLDLDSKSLIIFGENGKGKSSIIDGVEYAITKDIKHISSACREVSLQKHAPNISANFQDIKVQVEFKDGSILSNREEPKKDTLAYKINNSVTGNINILRRSQLLNAVFAQPKERYDLLKQFLPLTEINKFENASKGAVDKLKEDLISFQTEIENHKKNIQNTLDIKNLDSVTTDNITSILTNKGKQLNLEDLKNLEEIPRYIEKVEDYVKSIGNIKLDTVIRSLLSLLSEVIDKKSPEQFAKVIFDNINSKLDLVEKQKIIFYEEFLTTGIQWLQEDNKSLCPFCESPIDVPSVVERVNKRIEENSEYSTLKKEFQKHYDILQSELKCWKDKVVKIRSINKELNDGNIEHLCKTIEDNTENFIKLVPKSIQENIIEKNLPNWDDSIYKNANYLKNEYSNKLIPNDTVSLVNQAVRFIHDLKIVNDNLININKKTNQYNISNKRYKITKKFYEELVRQRKNSVQEIYNDIREDINNYYNSMHPEENIGGIDLKIKDSSSKGSAIIESSFYEKDGEDPRAYYSEAHLDTLGLSMFLALYKRECLKNKDLKFLILDDIFTSVDASHRINIINLIFTEFKEHQLIITTHDIVLYREILELEKLYGGNSKFKNIEICEWVKDEGPILDDTRSEIEKLIQLSNNHRTDKSILASATGIFLELLLSKLRYSLELSIPAKYQDKYTIADIWNNLYSKLKKNKEFYNSNSKVLDAINTSKFIRNTNGCHYNEWAQGVSKDEIRQFTNNVISFYEIIYCSNCNSLIKKSNGNEDYQCKCSRLQYQKSKLLIS